MKTSKKYSKHILLISIIEILIAVLLFCFLGFYACTSSVSLTASAGSPDSLSIKCQNISQKVSGQTTGSTQKYRAYYFKRVSPFDFSFELPSESVSKIKIRSGFSRYEIPEALIKLRLDKKSVFTLSRTDLYHHVHAVRGIPGWWYLLFFASMFIIFDLFRKVRFSSDNFQKSFRIFIFVNCLVLAPAAIYWFDKVIDSHQYIRIVPHLTSQNPMKLKFYYSAGNYRISESQTRSSATQLFRKYEGLPLIFHFPDYTDFRELRIDFETRNNTVKLSKIEIKKGFSTWTIPGKLLPEILRTRNDIDNISVKNGEAVFKIGNQKDAYIVFDPGKFKNLIKPKTAYPWLDFLMFPIAELFLIMVLYMYWGPKAEKQSLSVFRIGMAFLKIYIFLALLFLLLRITGALLPWTPGLYNNMQQNILMANHEGLYHPINGVLMNNFTDIAEFSHGYYLQPETPLFSSLQCRRSNVAYLPQKWNTNIIIGSRLYTEGLFPNQLGLIRYWVGSSSLWRFLSEFITYKEIRTIFSFILLALCAVMLCLAWQRTGLYSSVCLALMLSTSAISLLFISTSFYWSILGMLVLSSYILHKEKIQLIEYASAFFITGAFVVYIELFINPMLSLVVPGILAMMRIYQDNPRLNWKKTAGCFFTLNISWVSGYALIWGTKWLIASLVFPGAITQILNSIRYRSSTLDVKSKQISRFAGLITNFNEFIRLNSGLIVLSAILLLIVTVIMVMAIRKHKIKYPFPLACATVGFALIPIGWQIVTANHAIIHFWMTYKTLSGTFFGLLVLPGLPFLNVNRKVLYDDFKCFCRRIRFPEFVFFAAASFVLLTTAAVLTGIFGNRSLPYRSSVILESKIPYQVILRNKHLDLKTDKKSNHKIISAPVSDWWTRCSWEIQSPQTGQIIMKMGCQPNQTRYGMQNYTVEYKQIVIDGKLHPGRVRHFSAYSFPEIPLTVREDKPLKISCLVRLHPNWGNENQQ